MGFSIKNQLSQSVQYQAPNPVFIRTVIALGQGIPWDRFERLFKSQPLIQASANDQVFLLRILAMQELLCVDDQAMLNWLKNQMHLFAFISDVEPKLPNVEHLSHFRQKLDSLQILQPFRKRCQRIILNHEVQAEPLMAEPSKDAFDVTEHASKPLTMLDIEERWVICPLCDSSSLEAYVPDHLTASDHQPWADCQKCGHKFKVG